MSGHSEKIGGRSFPSRTVFPFAAVVGQGEMKLALLLNVIAPSIGGVLVSGHRGTGKSTAVRALADLLPPQRAVRGCAFGCDPGAERDLCADCRARLAAGARLTAERRPVSVVELPLGATEDRVCGTIDIERALRDGVKSFEPGLLARANRGFLYIDEVNLLEDHLVDLLLDVAATGTNRVEREGVSAEHPARFVLVGSANPEEGELRPQLLDRFGLCVEVTTEQDLESRVLIVERREAFERDPPGFAETWKGEQDDLRRRLLRAGKACGRVEVPRPLLRAVAELCLRLKTDGHRGELTVTRAARALAAFEGRRRATPEDVRRVAAMSLRHRLRRDPFEAGDGGSRVEEVLEELFGESPKGAGDTGNSGGEIPMGSNGHDRSPRRPPVPETTRHSSGLGGNKVEDERQAEEKLLPPAESSLRPDALADSDTSTKNGRVGSVARRRRGGSRTVSDAARGRYAGATASPAAPRRLALDATLRAAASHLRETSPEAADRSFDFDAADLRFKRLRARQGTLYIFAVDASGSMALNRAGQAKGALARLLRRSYVNRDRVALVSFRGREAQTLLRPSGSPALARRLLDALPVGGPTPLAAGLRRVLEIARRASASGATQVRLVLFTDGRANVAAVETHATDAAARRRQIEEEIAGLGAALRAAGVVSTVVDTRNRFTSDGAAGRLAANLGGSYVQLQ